MNAIIELYSGTYKNYAEDLYKRIREETYGEDIGQNSWLTAHEYRAIFRLLKLSSNNKVLEIATGSGGPAVFMVKETGCELTGIEINENGVSNAKKLASETGLQSKMRFLQADASNSLPFSDETFDAVISIDSINHLRNRVNVLKEFRRVLKSGGHLLYTDPIVVTGALTNEEIAIRSSIGFFLFVPPGENEKLLKESGFRDIYSQDVTDNIATISIKWYSAREKSREELLKIEEEKNYNGLQSFLKTVHLLSSEKRLSRFLLFAKK